MNTTKLLFVLFTIISVTVAYADEDVERCENQTQMPLAECLFKVAVTYQFSARGSSNLNRACDLYQRSAEMGYGPAQYNLGHCYLKGKGRKQDLKLAEYWHTLGAKNGIADSKTVLAQLYLFEDSDPEKYQTAITYLHEVLNKKDDTGTKGFAEFTLCAAYLRGIGVSVDINKALPLCTRAAHNRNIFAQALLSHIYEAGLYGVTKDLDAAKKWREVLEQQYVSRSREDAPVEHALALIYKHGWGVPKNQNAHDHFMELASRPRRN